MLINIFQHNWFTLFYVFNFMYLKTLFLEVRAITSLDYQRGLSHKKWIKSDPGLQHLCIVLPTLAPWHQFRAKISVRECPRGVSEKESKINITQKCS